MGDDLSSKSLQARDSRRSSPVDYASLLAQLLGSPENLGLERRACPDQYVGLIADLAGAKNFSIRQSLAERPPGVRCLILILESPHKREYASQPNGESVPCPANGATGRNIAKHLPTMGFERGLGLILFNAIPFQCSLGQRPFMHRDAEFLKLWLGGGESYFIDRLRKVFREGDIFMNCCTKGAPNLTPPLRDLVQTALRLAFPSQTVVRRKHPSSWFSGPGGEWALHA